MGSASSFGFGMTNSNSVGMNGFSGGSIYTGNFGQNSDQILAELKKLNQNQETLLKLG